jgi:hypothetical protein
MLRRKLAEWVYEILEQQDGTEAGVESRGEGQERGRGGGQGLSAMQRVQALLEVVKQVLKLLVCEALSF